MTKKKIFSLVELAEMQDDLNKDHANLVHKNKIIEADFTKEVKNENSKKRGVILNSDKYAKDLKENVEDIEKNEENQSKVNKALEKRLELVNKKIEELEKIIKNTPQKQNLSFFEKKKDPVEKWKEELKDYKKEFSAYEKHMEKTGKKQLQEQQKLQEKQREEKKKLEERQNEIDEKTKVFEEKLENELNKATSVSSLEKKQEKFKELHNEIIEDNKDINQKLKKEKIAFRNEGELKQDLQQNKEKLKIIEKLQSNIIGLKQIAAEREKKQHQEEKILKEQQNQQKIEKEEKKKEEKKEKKKVEKQLSSEEKYPKEKKKLYEILGGALNDDKSLKTLLVDMVPKTSEKKGGIKKGKAVLGGIGFALSNLGTVFKAATSASFFKEEAEKMGKIISGKEKLDPKNPPFFLKLIQDPETVDFFQKNPKKFENLLDQVLPEVIPVVFAELGKVDSLEKELKKEQKEFQKLVETKIDLFNKKEKLDPQKDKEKIKELDKQLKENQKKIDTQGGEISGLQTKLQIAYTIDVLNKSGVGEEYIKTKLLPIITEPIKGFLVKNPKNFMDIANLAIKLPLTKDPQERVNLVGQILNKVDIAQIVKQTNLTNILASETKPLSKIAAKIGEVEPVKKILEPLGVTPKLIEEITPTALNIASSTIPLVTDLASKVISNSGELGGIYSNVMEIQNAKDDPKKQQEATKNLIGNEGIKKIANDLIPVIKEDIPKFLEQNKQNLTDIAGKVVELEPVKKILEPLGVTPKLIEELTPTALNLASSTIPLVTNLASKVISNSGELGGIYSNVMEIQNAKDDPKKQQEATKNLIGNEGIKKIANDLIPVIKEDIPKFLEQNKQNLANVAGKVVELEPVKKILKPLGVTPELVEKITPEALSIVNSALPFVGNIAAEIVNNSGELGIIYDRFQDFQKANKELKNNNDAAQQTALFEKQQLELAKLLHDPAIQKVANTLIPTVLEKNLHRFILENKQPINNLIDNITSSPTVARTLEANGIPPELIKNAANVGLDLVKDLTPIISTIATESVKKPEALYGLINGVQDVLGASKEEQKDKVLKLVGSIIDFKNNNPHIKDAIDKQLPQVLEKHSKEIGEVVDQFLSKTPIGRNLHLKGEKLVGIVSKNLPQVMEVADAFTKKQYGKMIFKAIPLLFKKDVLSTVINAALDGRRFKKEQERTAEDRRKQGGKDVEKGLKEALTKADYGSDLGTVLEENADKVKTNTGKHAFKSHDLKDFHFKEPLRLDNLKIVGINFTGAQFAKGTSFENCRIVNTDFTGVKFTGPVNLQNITIDEKSFESLTKAIGEHNKQFPKNPVKIDLDKIKIIKPGLSEALETIKEKLGKHKATGQDTKINVSKKPGGREIN
jgi:hypothetical protein